MSVTITDEQYAELMSYARELRDGNTFDIGGSPPMRRYFTESRHHYDRLCALIAGLRQQSTQAENDEAVIRHNLQLWARLQQ